MTASQIAAIRAEFPLIAKHDRVYFDNAATEQRFSSLFTQLHRKKSSLHETPPRASIWLHIAMDCHT